MANYLYNGIALPALPVYDKEQYPYAAIVQRYGDSNDNWYELFVNAEPFSMIFHNGENCIISTSPCRRYGCYVGDAEFDFMAQVPNYNRIILNAFPVWTDENIYDEHGMLYLAASEPVPVGGEPETPTKALYYSKGGVWRRLYRKTNGAWEEVDGVFGLTPEVRELKELHDSLGVVEPFIYFTDPHLCEGVGWQPRFHEYMAKVKQAYDNSPCKLVICGGDWIGNSDTKEQATYKLRYVADYMRRLFGNNHMLVLGNHDTNYQGTEQLTQEELIELWFKDTNTGKPYYYHDTENARYFVLDTQTDWAPEWTDYCAEQVQWLRANLSDKKNVVVVHIDWLDTDCTSQTALTSAVSSMYGVDLILSGHIHADHELVTGLTVPEVSTTNLQAAGIPTFDLCALDASGNKLHMVRVGHGTNRVIDMEVEE